MEITRSKGQNRMSKSRQYITMTFQMTGDRMYGLVNVVGTVVYLLEGKKKFPTLGNEPKITSKWIKFHKSDTYKNISKEMTIFIWVEKMLFKTCQF